MQYVVNSQVWWTHIKLGFILPCYIEMLPQIWDHNFKTVFHILLLCVVFKAQNCLETWVNCVWNCLMSLFTPLEVQFSEEKISKTYSSFIWNAKLAESEILKDIDEKNQGYFCVKLVDALIFQENGLAITFTWQNEP